MSTTTTTATTGGPKLRLSCDSCKGAKIRCGQGKPACKRCREHGITCQYSPSRRMGRPRNRTTSKEPAPENANAASKSSPGASVAPGQQDALPQLLPSLPQGTPSTSASEFPIMSSNSWDSWNVMGADLGSCAPTPTPGNGALLVDHRHSLDMPDYDQLMLNDYTTTTSTVGMDGDLLAFDDSFLTQWTVADDTGNLGQLEGDATTMMALDPSPGAGQSNVDLAMSQDTSIQREGAPALVQTTALEKKALLQAIDDPNSAGTFGCRLGPVLASCEKLTTQLAIMSGLDKCATRLSTAMAECHTIRVVAQSLANGLTRCCEDRSAAAAAAAAGMPEVRADGAEEERQRSASPTTQMLRFGNYQVQVTRENELVRALVRRRFEILQKRLEEISDGNRPRSLREEIRRCVLAELRSDLSGMLAEF